MRSLNLGRLAAVSLLLALPFALARVADGSSREFWVAPTGNDASPGTRSAPFRTLQRARDAVRAGRRRTGWTSQLTVMLRGGTYRLEQPLVLDARDSGEPGRDVTFRAAAGERPVISGAMRVRDWRLYDPGLGIHRAFVGPRKSRQLYVNGRRAVRAQTEPYPAGFLPVYYWIGDIGLPVGIEFIPTVLNPGRWRDPSTWSNPQNVEAVIATQWKTMRVPLASITSFPGFVPDPLFPEFRTGLLTVQEPAWTNANVFVDQSTGQPGIWSFWQVTRFENAYQFLDQPGEWYLDEATGWLYYLPRPGENLATADVELPLLQTLVEGRGDPTRPVANIRFEGLTFSGATWLAPSGSDGYVSDQSGFHLVGAGHRPNIIGHDRNVVRTPGNVRFRFAHQIVFRGNVFEHLGGAALDFDTGSQGNVVRDNLFDDISSSAIELGGITPADHHPDRPAQVTRGNQIANNLIRRVAQEYLDAAGVYVGFTQRTLIEHNTILDVPWSGIAVGWGWGLLDPSNFPGLPGAHPGEWGLISTPTPNRENVIRHNRIRGFVGALWDGGAIYTTGQQGTSLADGLLIEGNVASGKRPKGGSNVFYTDGGSRYLTLRNNVSFDNPIGVTDFGPLPKPGDPLPYSFVPGLGNGIPYGSDSGGCRTYGDINFVQNYWLQVPLLQQEAQFNQQLFPLLRFFPYSPNGFFNICPYSADGITYPTNLRYRNNHAIRGPVDVPARILRAAGVRNRPATIPVDRWSSSP